jgi:arsenite transporter
LTSEQPAIKEEAKLGFFEKYLTLWIVVCIIAGILLGSYVPQLVSFLEAVTIAELGYMPLPIGIFLFLVMYPTVASIKFKDIKKAAKAPKPTILTLIANWVIAPPLMVLLASIFLSNYPEFAHGVILLGIAPCTAMVLFWILFAKGNVAQGLIITAINAVSIVILYAPSAAFWLGVTGINVFEIITNIALSVVLFVGLPIVLGVVLRREFIRRKGEGWYNKTYLGVMNKLAIIGLLGTLIVMFTYEGHTILAQPFIVGLIAIPVFLHEALMLPLLLGICWFAKWDYETSVVSAIIGSSTHFEIAITVAITLFGVGSGAALATVVGPLMEVPVMVGFAKLALRTRHRFPRNRLRVKSLK